MPAILLEGRPIAEKIKSQLKEEVMGIKSRFNTAPTLATIQVGENSSAAIYLKSQKKFAKDIDIGFQEHPLPASTSEKELIDYIEKLNSEKSITGILLQLPLPNQINAKDMPIHINPLKDVEGMHPENVGQAIFGKMRIGSCTALAVMELIKSTGVDLYGKEAVIVGHSEIVGKPVSLLLLDKFATTTTCHIATGQRGYLPTHVKRAEILVVAVGRPGIIQGEWVKEGAVVIDVGINRVGEKIVGDVEFEKAAQRASYITPVPGGVGPLTVTMLMRNTVEAFKLQRGR
ncbi:MAG: bifunctional 5,10-methylene-tetrahydrofolate dehydrogenase/5,10-methylene-tetrahydrofolate cyclohydrolase [Omnitrophica bacterium RIFCSPLOWO2_01_FULL_45_10]|nr:MAG: bifunctional 5,10-methylene-tetrahydrofolate dehydrogenase/5,10-methylene-tetrahydrofolate cyclohydrolase [Omnitrophica bacterium RIFCSPLOWO2_01_FULL_45_10]